MQKITKNVDALGFDKWQIADVKRAYASNKTTYTKMNRLAEKIKALGEQYEQLKAELAAWEGPVAVISNKVLGMELTSQEVLAFHKEPKLFAERFPEHPKSAEILSSLAEAPETPAEETGEGTAEEPEGTTAEPIEGAF